MDLLWLVLTLLLAALWVAWLVRVVRRDGLGHREPPPSHPHETQPALTQVLAR